MNAVCHNSAFCRHAKSALSYAIASDKAARCRISFPARKALTTSRPGNRQPPLLGARAGHVMPGAQIETWSPPHPAARPI